MQKVIFFFDIQQMAFSRKFKKQTKVFILNEKCVFLYCKAVWHRFKSNLNIEISSISTSSVFWAQSLNPCKKPMTKNFFLMKWQHKSWTVVKIYRKFPRNQISHFRAPAAIKYRLNLFERRLEKCRCIPLYGFIETIVALYLKALSFVEEKEKNKVLGV